MTDFYESPIFTDNMLPNRAKQPKAHSHGIGAMTLWLASAALTLSTVVPVVGASDVSEQLISPQAITAPPVEAPPAMPEMQAFASRLEAVAQAQGVDFNQLIRQASSWFDNNRIEPRQHTLTEEEIDFLISDDAASTE